MSDRNQLLGELYDLTLADLITKVKDGKADSRILAVAIKFLKDNGIESLPTASPNLDVLKNLMPEAFGGPTDQVQ